MIGVEDCNCIFDDGCNVCGIVVMDEGVEFGKFWDDVWLCCEFCYFCVLGVLFFWWDVFEYFGMLEDEGDVRIGLCKFCCIWYLWGEDL